MNQNNRKASIFMHDQFLLNNVDFNSLDLQKSDENVWLILDNYNGLKNEKSNIKIKIEKVISENELKEYPYIVNEGFKRSNESDPYDGLTDSVIDAIRRRCYINGKFITEHYIAKYNNEIVGTITIMYEKNIAFIYNVTANVKFRRKGVCSQLMNHVVQILNNIGIEKIILQTAPGYYPEKIYKNMGFKELFYGVKYTEK